ncbi:type III secretion system HrpE/YscL family protein [Collimonas sp. PA-H2]|uniref:type III secretion system stator protein SctL n=1 Tax=Collimonas sp. PA-H2 TaxID=1881062 RepID=UPI000C01072F|nr:type III secretion system stator protein SctL [Collimonas sp. PA-H2]PFH08651.1 type III secretion system HrpE/YscL family protein [Collimonas sp. PA-H2]
MQGLTLLDKRALAVSEGKVVKAEAYATSIEAAAVLAEACAYAKQRRVSVDAEIARECEAGYQEGYAKASQDFAARMVDSVMRLESTYIGLEARLVNTVMNALKTVLGSLDESLLIEKLVRQVIHAAGQEKKLCLRVAANQFEEVNEILQKILRDYPYVEFIDVAKDPHMRFGDCVLETEYGAVDGGLEHQLNAIRQSLISVFAGRRAESSGSPTSRHLSVESLQEDN